MWRAVLWLLLVAACGKVAQFTDAGVIDGSSIDGKAGVPDATPFVCDQQACGPSDSCCPASCNANNDPDCQPTCGNGVIEASETCDPVGTCPTSCPQIGCTLQTLANPGTCQAACVDGGQQTQCVSGDGCCPNGCNATNDVECAASCGNGITEPGETCDGNCPTSCPQQGCQLYTLFNAGTCQAQCVGAGTQGQCVNGDGCCAAGCNANNDSDCAPVCGNNVVEPGETCDGNCPTCSEAYSCWTSTGSAATCDLRCHLPDQTCGGGDACCPYIANGGGECTANDDRECTGPSWQYMLWPVQLTWTAGSSATALIYGIDPGGSYLFTTCMPPGVSNNQIDTMITSVTDTSNVSYLSGIADDSGDPGILPRLAGWTCTIPPNNSPYLSTAPLNDGGLIAAPNVFGYRVTVTGYNNGAGTNVLLYIWYNAPTAPHLG